MLDRGTGMWAAIGVVAALYRRQFTWEGCLVDTSLFETALGWLKLSFGTYKAMGTAPARLRTGSSRIVVFQALDTCPSNSAHLIALVGLTTGAKDQESCRASVMKTKSRARKDIAWIERTELLLRQYSASASDRMGSRAALAATAGSVMAATEAPSACPPRPQGAGDA